MKTIEEYGELFLGTRLKRLSDLLYDEVDKIFAAQEINLGARVTSVIFMLHQNGSAGITQIADALGITHPAVNQMSKKLNALGYVENMPDPHDDRRRLLTLTHDGEQLVQKLIPIWEDMRSCLDEMLKSSEHSMLTAIYSFEQQNQRLPLAQRLKSRLLLKAASDVEIITYESRYAEDFKRLNIEWLEKYFYVEEYDFEVLSNPEKYILSGGGNIYFARYRGETIGTVALMVYEDGRVELTKMSVTEKYQGLKVGRKLMEFAIARYQKFAGTCLFLESNSRLKPALTLYEKMGFVHKPNPTPSHYQRGDVYMEFEENYT